MVGRISQYEFLPEDGNSVARVVNDIRRGRLDCSNTVEVPAGASTFTISNYAFGPQTVVFLVPASANAAGAAWWLQSVTKGLATFGITSLAGARTFRWVALG